MNLPIKNEIKFQSDIQASHRKQMAWQVYLPLGIAIAILAAGTIGIASGGADQTGKWAGVSIIFLILPTLAVGLLGLIVIGLAIYGLIRFQKGIPSISGKVFDIFGSTRSIVAHSCNQVVHPMIALKSWMAGVQALFHKKR